MNEEFRFSFPETSRSGRVVKQSLRWKESQESQQSSDSCEESQPSSDSCEEPQPNSESCEDPQTSCSEYVKGHVSYSSHLVRSSGLFLNLDDSRESTALDSCQSNKNAVISVDATDRGIRAKLDDEDASSTASESETLSDSASDSSNNNNNKGSEYRNRQVAIPATLESCSSWKHLAENSADGEMKNRSENEEIDVKSIMKPKNGLRNTSKTNWKRNLGCDFKTMTLKRKTAASRHRNDPALQERHQQYCQKKRKMWNFAKGKNLFAKARLPASDTFKPRGKKVSRKNRAKAPLEPDATLEEPLGQDLSDVPLGVTPMDAAAHLMLLGNNMTRLGLALDFLDRDVDATAMYSCLLDSLLCAVAPLLCLTRCVSGLEHLPVDTFRKTLDHVAYFLPGVEVIEEKKKI